MVELPKNEAELQALLDAKEQETAEKWKAKHDGEMASMRKKHDEELKRAKEQANMTAEELAEQSQQSSIQRTERPPCMWQSAIVVVLYLSVMRTVATSVQHVHCARRLVQTEVSRLFQRCLPTLRQERKRRIL